MMTTLRQRQLQRQHAAATVDMSGTKCENVLGITVRDACRTALIYIRILAVMRTISRTIPTETTWTLVSHVPWRHPRVSLRASSSATRIGHIMCIQCCWNRTTSLSLLNAYTCFYQVWYNTRTCLLDSASISCPKTLHFSRRSINMSASKFGHNPSHHWLISHAPWTKCLNPHQFLSVQSRISIVTTCAGSLYR